MMPTPILFVDHATALGGAEHSLLLLLEHLDQTVWQPHLASPEGDLAQKGEALGVHRHAISLPQLRRSPRFLLDWKTRAQQLADISQQVSVAALYANTVRAALYVMLAAQMAKRPFIWHMRDFWLSESEPAFPQIDWAIKKLLCRAARHIIVNSAATATHLPCSSKISIVPNGIDLTQFTPASNAEDFRQNYDIPVDALLVGMVGRLRPWKGQARFIEMAAKVIVTNPNTYFVIVGGTPFGIDDGYREQLKALTRELQVTHRVRFTGQLTDVRLALAALDIFVHPGEPEPFGLVNIEAMAMGKPAVAFAHGALPEIVVPQGTGILVPPGNVAEMAAAVGTLLQSPRLCQQLGQAGQRRAAEKFSIQQTAVHIQSILSEQLGNA